MAAGGRVAAAPNALVMAVAALLLAAVARADCFDYCFKNCIAKDKSMRDYCNYACDKTCEPGATPRPLAASAADAGDMACQLSCTKTSCHRLRADEKAMEACFGQCYDGCKTKTLQRPLRAGAGVPSAEGPVSEARHSADLYPLFPSSEPDPDNVDASEKHPSHEKQDAVQPASETGKQDDAHRPASKEKDDAVGPASEPDRTFHEKQDGVQPASEPDRTFHEKQDGVQPASEPDRTFHEKQDGVQPASEPDRTFHEKQDGVQPASEPDRTFHEKQDGVQPASEPDRTFHEKQDGVQPASEPDRTFHEKQDGVQPESEPDRTFHEKQDSLQPASEPDRTFHEKQDGVQPASVPDKDDSLRPAAWSPVLPESEIHAAPPAHG